jgi:hypothetical protein
MNSKNKIGVVLLLIICISLIPTVLAQTGEAQLSATIVTQYPDLARSGDVVEVRIRLDNKGTGTASAVIAEILEEYPFTLLPGQNAQTTIGSLPHYPKEANFKTLLYKMHVNSQAIDGKHELKFRYSENEGVSWIVKSFTIDITSKEFAQIIHVDKSQINPGEETPIIFTINNIGKAPLTNMVFTWGEKDNVILPINTDNTRYIPYIGVGESIDLKYTVIADPSATRGLYNLDLTLTFDSKNASGTVNDEIKTKAGVLVGGSTDFDVAFAESNAGKTSFTIANIGENDASSVTISIPEQGEFTVRGGESVIIGNLNKGDFTLATFQVVPSSITKGEESKTLTVVLSFTDSFGKRHKLTKEIPLKVYPGFGQEVAVQKQRSPLTTVLIIVVIVGIAIFVYKRHKKGKPIIPKAITGFWHKRK